MEIGGRPIEYREGMEREGGAQGMGSITGWNLPKYVVSMYKHTTINPAFLYNYSVLINSNRKEINREANQGEGGEEGKDRY